MLGFSIVESVIVVVGVVVCVVTAVEHTVVVSGVGSAVIIVVGLVKTIVGTVNVEVVVAITTVPVGKVVGVTAPPRHVSQREQQIWTVQAYTYNSGPHTSLVTKM